MRASGAVSLLFVAVLGVSMPASARSADGPTGVVAVIDTGINPYHDAFRDERPIAYVHPSKYIEGFPRSAQALRLTLDEADYWKAFTDDCDEWEKVKTGKLYWIPGTKIVGAITFDESDQPINCQVRQQPPARILDDGAHGTMTASRAVADEYGACSECRVVAIQGFTTKSVDWAAKNASWIDAQSNSWGPFLPVWTPQDPLDLWNTPGFVRSVEAAAKKHLSFWASGNGTLTRFGAVGHPTLIDPRMTPSIVMVGGHDSGYINLWPDFPPHVVSDSCNSMAAYHDDVAKADDTVGSGTSSATPFAAGGAVKILLEARRILGDDSTGVHDGVVATGPKGLVSSGPLRDGRFTMNEWKDVVFKTASERPRATDPDGSTCTLVQGLVIYGTTPVPWESVPEQYPEYLHIGYGAVDRPSIGLAFEVLRGTEELPDRSDTDAYFETERPVREQLHGIYDG